MTEGMKSRNGMHANPGGSKRLRDFKGIDKGGGKSALSPERFARAGAKAKKQVPIGNRGMWKGGH